jgi:hypothetical protein
MFVHGEWIDVPHERIQYRALEGDTGVAGAGHWCGDRIASYDYGNPVVYTTRCAILPPNATGPVMRDGWIASQRLP